MKRSARGFYLAFFCLCQYLLTVNILSQSSWRIGLQIFCRVASWLSITRNLFLLIKYFGGLWAFRPSLYGIRCCVRNFFFGKHYFLLISKERNILVNNIRCDYMKTSLIWVRFDFHQRFLHVVQCIRHQLLRKKDMFISMYLGAFIWLINRKVMKHFLRWTRKTIVRLSLFKFASKWDSVDL